MSSNSGSPAKGRPSVTFSLDGVEHTVTDPSETASAVLQLAGLDPAEYDLLRVVGKGEEQRFHDQDKVQLVPGGRYLSLFTGSTPIA
jgi:hypothetical protein